MKNEHTMLDIHGLDKVVIIYPGDKRFPLSEQVEALSLTEFANPNINIDDLFEAP